MTTDQPDSSTPIRRLRACVENWPEAETGGYDPRCCRFPKSCSATVYDEDRVADQDLEPVTPTPAEPREPAAAVRYDPQKVLAIAHAASAAQRAQQEVARLIREEAYERGKTEGIAEERARAAAAIADRIRAELVCCYIYDEAEGDEAAIRKLERAGHAICFWGEAGARLAERYATGGSDAA